MAGDFKKIVFVFIFALGLLPVSVFAKAKTDLIVGLWDMQEVLLKVDEAQGVRKKFEEFVKSKQDLLKANEEKFKKLQEDYEKQRASMNEKTKAEKEKELRDFYVGHQQKSMQYQQEIKDLDNKLKAPILERIRKVQEAVSEKANIFITFEGGQSSVTYAVNLKDLTADIIQAYNKEYPAKK